MNRLLALREESHSRRQKLVLALAAASCLVVAAALISMDRDKVRKPVFEANTTVVSETVNLWDAGTLRGQQTSPLAIRIVACHLGSGEDRPSPL